MKRACRYLCKVFGMEKKTVRCLKTIFPTFQERELLTFLKEFDTNGDGNLDFIEFKEAMRQAQEKKKNQLHKDEIEVFEECESEDGDSESSFVTYLLVHG